ncbi:DUF4252 domain-containing protein [Ulvibacter antarcticus]|uniref:Uncharacterized protein DUF4252 n=1 Tax=Ulvibacter antarcticus TaxID=442714 RepID=A0A3L9ZD92_9FLAO|nr:DUF4252 domain-containing protein [Ulvibacter antarcticus]RMA64622.1 uncharacterized protein DUF4252 [Ulvibacter antarcticus]
MAVLKYILPLAMTVISLFSCSNNESLQRYLVDKQDDDKFLKVDVATSLLQSDENTLSEEQKEILNTVKKINVVAYKIKDGNMADYEAEKGKLAAIVSQEKYKTLMKYGSKNKGATLKYLGEEDAIDEVVVFASDNEQGFAVFRLSGNNMRPDQIMKLIGSVENGDIDISKLSGLGDIFKM